MKRAHIPEARWCLEWPRDVFICYEDIWTCVHTHENHPNILTKGAFLDSPQNSWTCSFKDTDAHDSPGRTWNCSVCALGYESVLLKHIQMLTPGLLALLHVNIPSCLPSASISWEASVEGKWLYNTLSLESMKNYSSLSTKNYSSLYCLHLSYKVETVISRFRTAWVEMGSK